MHSLLPYGCIYQDLFHYRQQLDQQKFVVWGICCLHRKWVHWRNHYCISILAFVRIPNVLEVIYNYSPFANDSASICSLWLSLLSCVLIFSTALFQFYICLVIHIPPLPCEIWVRVGTDFTKCTLIVFIILYPWKILFSISCCIFVKQKQLAWCIVS